MYFVEMQHINSAGQLTLERTCHDSYLEARIQLAAEVRSRRRQKSFYVVRNGRDSFYFCKHYGLSSTVARIVCRHRIAGVAA